MGLKIETGVTRGKMSEMIYINKEDLRSFLESFELGTMEIRNGMGYTKPYTIEEFCNIIFPDQPERLNPEDALSVCDSPTTENK